ncbi:s-adenosylmethionine transporter [Phaffia rhodozyma]|uniref:S-adenosylmethionine transporter n=1 Tax=Phaffia rhodozyma TaxID=264483 RepID=A0A0F7SFA7_PHARH|nr:s-adenosylmethionine transporter [Phaffia rhodozyma]
MADADALLDKALPVPSVKPTFPQALVAGAMSGLSVDLMFFPIDTLKTRLQSQKGFLQSGGFNGVYKGIGSVFVGGAPGAAAFFTTYEYLKTSLSKDTSLPSAFVHMTAASGGELAACLIRVPTEVIKTRAQTSAYGTSSAGSLNAAKSVWREEGLRGFSRGFGMTVAREIPFTSIQFPLYEYLKATLATPAYLDRPTLPHEAALCGSVAGGIAAALTTPLDVVKTRVMLEVKGSAVPRGGSSFLSIPGRMATIAREEGPRALFSGVVPRTLWISVGGAVFLGVYEAAGGALKGII